ncbi:Frag1/DRAM/Sfk1 family protein [Aspergillus clavatus NRRL 1]|uniref:FK506 suppressor Sfk1, putative n=1 Tax=Aspergillus clavatus (strain ATCC 1007 / CBS 513.65 / DSM 816 / NCTC 3887 / NRRL 1 / QM 1276 / 107) TaxID=344612 RepID=A1CE54_ASPCL|nr:FK506 suppressor Sfk1, putative [Aspergillus clavatus NRRL 1]EAW11153.1 FK506 suppressor Sfk1, putative [Aspergillus clavatus NRRL 1]
MWIISFWIFPVISACMWLAMLIAMLANWAVRGTPIYASMEQGQTIAYISDIGAQGLKPLFITGSVITVVFLDLAFISERWLRHSGQLVPNKGWFDKTCAIASIFFAIAGAMGLILLSCYDTLHHPHKHDGFLVMFLVGYLISALLICAEYLRLGIFYRSQHRILFTSFVIKLSFIIIEIALAIAFGVCGRSGSGKKNVAAVLEWVIALVFTGYVLSFVVDLLPSVRTRRHVPQGEKRLEMAHTTPNAPHPANEEFVYEEPLTTDSAGPNANYYRGQRVVGN